MAADLTTRRKPATPSDKKPKADLAPSKRATITDVSTRAGVSVSTVSRVLNGGYASPEVQRRVERVTRELGFTPSSTARNLKRGREGCVGLVVESSRGAWFQQLLGGVEEELVDERVSILLGSLDMSGRYDANAVSQWITEHRVDGLIFVRCTKRERPIVEHAKRSGIPTVFVAPDKHFNAGPAFRAHNRDAAHDVADHLVALEHRSVAFVGGPEDSLDSQERLLGLREGFAGTPAALKPRAVTFAGTYAAIGGIDYAKRWLKMPRAQAPTAVVFGNDELALGFMRTVLEDGVLIPQGVSVVGFDGTPLSALYWPGLTTAEQPTRAMGKSACRALLRMTQNPEESAPSPDLHLQMTLRVRESTGPAPRR
jgi:DNA-binding LacI/PurR family transcriptional regulator